MLLTTGTPINLIIKKKKTGSLKEKLGPQEKVVGEEGFASQPRKGLDRNKEVHCLLSVTWAPCPYSPKSNNSNGKSSFGQWEGHRHRNKISEIPVLNFPSTVALLEPG